MSTNFPQRIFIAGFMGTGKTTVGKALARRLGYQFIDTDEEIVQLSGKTITKLFAQGEQAFRRWESKAIDACITHSRVVIALGGGAVCFRKNLEKIEREGVVVLLTANLKTLLQRTAGKHHRPLLPSEGRQAVVEALLKVRAPYYDKISLKISTDGKTPGIIAREIEQTLHRRVQPLWVRLGARSYPIFFRKSDQELTAAFDRIGPFERMIVITDDNIARLHARRFIPVLKKKWKTEIIVIPAGEKHKNLKTLQTLYAQMSQLKVDRKTPLLAWGGGVVGDIAGFAAATFLRGIPFFQVPTTLLAQVDSSVGGKTGVDLPAGKNLVGAFYQPKAVWIDTEFLSTLPLKEFICGLAEVIKYAVIFDQKLFKILEENIEGYLKTRGKGMEDVIRRCCEWKAWVVEKDEQESSGLRAKLNFGHTLGHAIESLTHYRKFTHGEAVAMGMVFAAEQSVEKTGLPKEQLERLKILLVRAGLPIQWPRFTARQYRKAMAQDKKRVSSQVHFVYLEKIGRSIVRPTPLEQIDP